MKRIIVHWSAGANTASALDRQHYYFIIQGDGTLVRANPLISGNAVPAASQTPLSFACGLLNFFAVSWARR